MRKNGEVLWPLLATITVSCLVALTAVTLRREFMPRAPERAPATTATERERKPPVPVSDWNSVAASGRRMGPETAPVTMVVFSDFECPSCARFATKTLPAVMQRFEGQMAVLYRHWPLSKHPLAYPAARAAECAAAQGQFEQYHNALFAEPSLIGVKPFEEFAREAGVQDLNAFTRCASLTSRVPAIDEDQAEAKRIGGTGTPTIVINGMRISPPYDPNTISRHVQAALEKGR